MTEDHEDESLRDLMQRYEELFRAAVAFRKLERFPMERSLEEQVKWGLNARQVELNLDAALTAIDEEWWA